MIRILLIYMLLATPGLAQQLPKVPSGQKLRLQEVVAPPDHGNLVYIGIVAPRLKRMKQDQIDGDMDFLCENFGKALAQKAGRPEVSIRLSQKPIAYGDTAPNIAQFLNFYDVSAGSCVWLP